MWSDQARLVGAGDIRYLAQGDGQTFLLIHGVGLRAEAWSAVVKNLAPQFRCVAVDMPGHGETPLNATRTLNEFRDRLAEFILENCADVCVVGHSMGALLALELAAKLPGRVSAVAALNAIYRRNPDAARAVRARAKELETEERADPTATLDRWFGSDPKGDTLACSRACDHWLSSGNRAGYAAAYRIFAHSEGLADTALRELTQPVLFLTGGADPNSTVAMSKAMAGIVPSGRAREYPDAAHMLPMTHAAALARDLASLAQDAQKRTDSQAIR
ncbi:MAG: alpha/beta hydrolase [Pseudomonadota bacterium]